MLAKPGTKEKEIYLVVIKQVSAFALDLEKPPSGRSFVRHRIAFRCL